MKKIIVILFLFFSVSVADAQWGGINTISGVGEVSGSATAKQLPTVTGGLCLVKAENGNAGDVYVGISGVTVADGTTDTTSGIELSASETTGWMPCTNLNNFYIITDNAGDDITYMVIK